MKSITRFAFCAVALVAAVGCASSKSTSHPLAVGEKFPRPGHIWVYDFAATPAEIPADSALAGQHSEHPAPQTPEEIATGRKVGAQLAMDLVEEIRNMGMPGARGLQVGQNRRSTTL